MTNKEMLSSTFPVIQNTINDQTADTIPRGWAYALKKVWLYLKGHTKERSTVADPAEPLISQIENEEVASIVRDLHYRTPKSLKTMRQACQKCFILPDDCPYYDYSIFDVKKAIRHLIVQPKHTHNQVVEELQKINHELAYHLNEYLH